MDSTLEHVLRLESRLLDPETRGDPARVASLLHPDFSEIGASGTIWSHADVLAALASDPEPRGQASDMAARHVGDGVVLVTYSAGSSLRSSLWVRGASGWRVLFHQGTARTPSEGERRDVMTEAGIEITQIGRVESPLTDPGSAPKQGDEGAPDAWLVFEPELVETLDGIEPGHEIIVLTWLDRARRDVLSVHPRGDSSRSMQGVFSTRSPHRPNPIGLHRVQVMCVDGVRMRVRNLEALDATPIIDVKPVLGPVGER